jgi:hypothetical protein
MAWRGIQGAVMRVSADLAGGVILWSALPLRVGVWALPDGSWGEVISVVQRRRRWTTEQKLALVEEAMRPGSSVTGVADRHGRSNRTPPPRPCS